MVGKYRVFLIVLGLLMTEAALGQANVAFRMVDAALVVVWHSVTRVGLPRLCAAQRDHETLVQRYGEIAVLPALIGLPVALGVALVAEDLVAALLGPSWAGAADAARISALAACIAFFHGDHFSLFVALGRARWNLMVAAATVVAPLLALLVLRPQTAAGAAMAWGTQAVLVTPVLIWMVLRQLRRSPLWLAKQVAPGAIAAAAMVPSVLLVQYALEDARPLLRLVAAAAIGAVVFAGVAWLALGRRLPAALLQFGGTQQAMGLAPEEPSRPRRSRKEAAARAPVATAPAQPARRFVETPAVARK